jgi:hypothetical protein
VFDHVYLGEEVAQYGLRALRSGLMLCWLARVPMSVTLTRLSAVSAKKPGM